MGTYNEIEGDLIALVKKGRFDVIAHGCNCFCTMGAGIAPQMAKAFGCDRFPLELLKDTTYYDTTLEEWVDAPTYNRGDINKLGQIDYQTVGINTKTERVLLGYSLPKPDFVKNLTVVNAYTQYHYGHKYGTPFDYEAFTLCIRKMNHIFKGKHIGLPQIGAGLAGGIWDAKNLSKVDLERTDIDFNDFFMGIKQIIQKELKDCDVTIVIYKP